MIQPEPNWAADLSGLQPGEAATNVPLPASGRLGVIEERCDNQMHEMYLVESMPCLSCGAAV